MPGKSRLNQDQIKESHSKRLPELIPHPSVKGWCDIGYDNGHAGALCRQ